MILLLNLSPNQSQLTDASLSHVDHVDAKTGHFWSLAFERADDRGGMKSGERKIERERQMGINLDKSPGTRTWSETLNSR